MNNLFGNIFGSGKDPGLVDLHKRAKKRLDRAMVPGMMKKDGTTGPGEQRKPKAPGGPSIWEKIYSGW